MKTEDRRRLRAAAVATAAATAALTALTAPPASARVDCGSRTRYHFTEVSQSYRLSNLRSDYLRGPGTITYQTTKTAQTTAQMSSTVQAEAGIVFAKASTSIGVSVARSWSKSGSWSYAKQVPAHTTQRLVMQHMSRHFRVTKQRYGNTSPSACGWSTVYSEFVNAPLTRNDNVWMLQRLR